MIITSYALGDLDLGAKICRDFPTTADCENALIELAFKSPSIEDLQVLTGLLNQFPLYRQVPGKVVRAIEQHAAASPDAAVTGLVSALRKVNVLTATPRDVVRELYSFAIQVIADNFSKTVVADTQADALLLLKDLARLQQVADANQLPAEVRATASQATDALATLGKQQASKTQTQIQQQQQQLQQLLDQARTAQARKTRNTALAVGGVAVASLGAVLLWQLGRSRARSMIR